MDIKRFQLISILENIRLNEKVLVKITCISVNNNDIYLGTAENVIFYYPNIFGKNEFNGHNAKYKYLGSKKEILQLQTAPVLNRLLCLSDSTLFVLNLGDLEFVNNNFKIKNVITFCVNENPLCEDPFSLEICLAKRKSVQICLMQADKMTIVKEVNISKPPLITSMDGQYICLVSESNYFMINWQNGSSQLLLSNTSEDPKDFKPICKHVTKEEFLVKGASHLGVFVKTSGISERPPIDWGMNVSHVAYSYPYILCLKESTVSIFSVIDQQLKEEFCFENGVYIDNFDGNILIVTTNSIFSLSRIPWEEQIDSLLSNGQAQEAVDLCQSLYESGFLSSKDMDYAKIVKEKAGLVELKKKNFDLSLQFLVESEFNVTDLLYCFDDIFQALKLNSNWIDNKDILDDLKIVIKERSEEFYQFTINFIDLLRTNRSDNFIDNELILNTATVLLLLKQTNLNFKTVQDFIIKGSLMNFELIESYLIDHQCYHLLATFYSSNVESYPKAIELWLKLEKGEIDDLQYSGLLNIQKLLEKCNDRNLILKYICILLRNDQTIGASVLISNTGAKESLLDPQEIVNLIKKYPRALILYLEHLVFKLNTKVNDYHTELASIYIDIISLQCETEEEDSELSASTKRKLDKLLVDSNLYDQKLILDKLHKNNMDYECAMLYGKIGEHKRAFEIYLIRYMDYDQALKHCTDYHEKDGQESNVNLYNILLSVYLDIYLKNGPEVTKPLLDFLNYSKSEIDLELALKIIPSDWPITLINRLLSKSLNSTYNYEFKTSFGKAFSIGEVTKQRQTKRKLLNKSVLVDRNSVCIVCNDLLYNSKFVWMPSTECFLHDYCFYGKS